MFKKGVRVQMSLAEDAYQEIMDKIINGTYLPGDMLSENELAKELGISRTPIRSAIAKFEDMGLFVSYRNRGVLFKDSSRRDILDGLELLFALITYIFEVRPKEQLDIDLDRLEKHLNLQLQAEEENDYVTYVQNAQLFLGVVIETGKNQAMMQIFNQNRDSFVLRSIINYNLNPQQKHYSANPQNKKIFETLKAGEFHKLKNILLDHYNSVRLRSFNERRY